MDDRDDWLEGVRRWYFGGTPGPDDLQAVPGLSSEGSVATEADPLALVPRHALTASFTAPSQACTPR